MARDRHVRRADLECLPRARNRYARQVEQHRNDRFAPEAAWRHPEDALVEKDGNDAIRFAVA